MNLSELSMRFRPIVLTLVGLLSAWGVFTFNRMSRREDPEFTIRKCVVFTRWPGAPTIQVEELITDKLEEVLDGIDEVDYLESETISGQSTIYVTLDDNVPLVDIQNVWDKVRAKVKNVEMPEEDVRPIVNDEFGDTTILLLGIYQTPLQGEDSIDETRKYTPRELEVFADQVRDAIRLLPGVAKVDKYGVQDEAIYIETDLGSWSQLAITSSSLRELITSRNIIASGGSIDTEQGKFNVKPGGEFDAVAEIRALPVGAVRSGDLANQVSLNDIGLSVNRGFVDPPEVICRFTEERGSFPAVMIGMTMKSGANIMEVCDLAMERIVRLVENEQALPRDIAVRPVSNVADNVSAKIDEVINNVISAIIIVVVVVYLFVGLRTSLVMAANIPIVVLSSVALMPMFGVELEQISLASVIISLGLLVDNAVQVCDQTRTNILAGMTPREAAIKGANDLMLPMLTGTLTTIAAFLPMLIALEGGAAEYVYSLPVTLSTTLLLSWFFAMSICVILAAAFIRAPANPDAPSAPLPWLAFLIGKWLNDRNARDSKKPGGENLFMRLYGITAKPAIKFKWVTVSGSVLLLGATLALPVSTEFFPRDRRDQFYITVTLPETATITQTDATVREIEEAITRLSPYTTEDGRLVERLRTMRSITGQGGARWALGVDPPAPGANTCELLIRTTDGNLTRQYLADVRNALENGASKLGIDPIAGARVTPQKLSLGPPAAPVEVRVSGDGFADIGELRRIADEVKDMIRNQPGTWDVSDSWGVDGFQLDIEVYDEKANLSGVSNAAIADTLNAYFSGVQLTKFREGDHEVPIYFRLGKDERADLSGLDVAFVEGQNGKVPLNSVAKITNTWQPAKIERRDQNRTISVSAQVEDGISGNDVVERVDASDQMKALRNSLPVGYKIEVGGALEESRDAVGQMMTSFAMSFVMIIMILVCQYNGWSKMLVILATLPLAVIGAWFGLWLTDNPLGFMPQLGLLSLFGIVLNTGIIFIEFADVLIARKRRELQVSGEADGPIVGLSARAFHDCLVASGKLRMLPIFLTTATTIGGLLPLALSGGPLWEGLAWLMIFGLIAATLLTLYVVPSLYAILVETLGIQPISIAPESIDDAEASDLAGESQASSAPV